PGLPPTAFSTLSLHDALPICGVFRVAFVPVLQGYECKAGIVARSGKAEALDHDRLINGLLAGKEALGLLDHIQRTVAAGLRRRLDRKSTRLNSSHVKISYAVF